MKMVFMRWSAFLCGSLFCATTWAQSPACSITTPAVAATINGTAYAITGRVAGYPSAYLVQILFDGEEQGTVALQPGQPPQNWSMNWNTNKRFDNPAAGFITANVLDTTGATICTSTNTGITINNAFRYTPSQIQFHRISRQFGQWRNLHWHDLDRRMPDLTEFERNQLRHRLDQRSRERGQRRSRRQLTRTLSIPPGGRTASTTFAATSGTPLSASGNVRHPYRRVVQADHILERKRRKRNHRHAEELDHRAGRNDPTDLHDTQRRRN